MTAKPTHNQLDFKEQYKLCTWVASVPDPELRTGFDNLSAKATTALGFKVTPRNIRSAAQAVGRKITTPRQPRTTGGAPAMAKYKTRVSVLLFAVVDLYTQLGMPLPPELIELARSSAQVNKGKTA